MDTFKISKPIFDEDNGNVNTDETFKTFELFLKECGYIKESLMKINEVNFTISLTDNTKSVSAKVEMIIGKKYIRLMNKRLSPTITSQLTYEKDLNFTKYKSNMDSIINSIKEFGSLNDELVNIIHELIKLESPDDYKKYESRFDVDEINVVGKDVFLTKNIEASDITVRICEFNGIFRFSVKYPEKEIFGMLDNFLPENDFEPKMTGIDNRIAEYNKIAGEIVRRVINEGKG